MDELLKKITDYFEKEVFLKHKSRALKENAKLSSYKINPILVRYLSKVLDDDFTPSGVAKALYYPRVLGTSINTTFGNRIQKMFVELELAQGSKIEGMDIEFFDKIEGKLKYCQLKSGPNTINSEDVKPIIDKFEKLLRRARGNHEQINNNDLIVGVLYGSSDELSRHYMRIDERYPVIIGKDFWHRITGYEHFYQRLVVELDKIITDMPTDNFLEVGCKKLEDEIKASRILDL